LVKEQISLYLNEDRIFVNGLLVIGLFDNIKIELNHFFEKYGGVDAHA